MRRRAPDGVVSAPIRISAGSGELEGQAFYHGDFPKGWDQDRLRYPVRHRIRNVEPQERRLDEGRLVAGR